MRTSRYTQVVVLLGLVVGFGAYVLLKPSASTGRGADSRSTVLRVVLFGPPPPSRDLGIVAPGTRVEVPCVLVNEGTGVVTLGDVVTVTQIQM